MGKLSELDYLVDWYRAECRRQDAVIRELTRAIGVLRSEIAEAGGDPDAHLKGDGVGNA